MSIPLWLGVIILSLYALAGLDLLIGNRTVRSLRDSNPCPAPAAPRISIIVAARNEERNILVALNSLIDLNYPDYELIMVDDRSEDRTGQFLESLVTIIPRLRVIRIDELPAGWLGKNHAQWVGSQRATGELLLFSDADIIMERTVLSRAVAFLEENRLDHLAATPSMHMPGIFLSMFGSAFIIIFSLFSRPWKAKDPASRCHIGIGAFNLVRSEAYRQVGGHKTIRLRPDDDLKLGKIIKQAGFRQDVVFAPEFLAVEWYASLRELIRGLEKNAFSGADYNIALVLFGVVVHVLCTIWPYLAIFVTHGATRAIYVIVVGLATLIFVDSVRFHGAKPWHALGLPFSSALFVFILLRTMILNIVQGGIYWRGTFYSLKELKGNRV